VLRVFVEASGQPSQLEVRTSSGYERLDKAALAAVARWKFVPARQGTELVGAWVLVPIIFSLKS
jgi:protein TonB